MKYLILIFLSILSFSAQCQDLSFKSKLTDQAGQPLSGATVLLNTAGNDTLVKATISGIEGQFLFENLKPGTYSLEISSIGFA